MTNATPCAVAGCERNAEVNGWCRGHAQRVKRNGHPGSPNFRRAPGSPKAECAHEGCTDPVRSRGWCAAHYQRWYDGRPLDGLIRHYEKTPQGPCSVEGCDETADSRGWCRGHYLRWWKTGSVGEVAFRRYGLIDVCSADGCDRPHRTKGFCDMHYRRLKRGVPVDSRTFLRPPPKMRADSYAAVHDRLRRERGRASEHDCIACGEQASQWAYQHNDPEPLLNAAGMPYSTRINHCYAPMCRSCHGQLDSDHDEREAIFNL